MTPLLLMSLKAKSKGEKKTIPQGWIQCLLPEKENEIPVRNKLIDVTTKSWKCFDKIGKHHQMSLFTMMKEWMTI